MYKFKGSSNNIDLWEWENVKYTMRKTSQGRNLTHLVKLVLFFDLTYLSVSFIKTLKRVDILKILLLKFVSFVYRIPTFISTKWHRWWDVSKESVIIFHYKIITRLTFICLQSLYKKTLTTLSKQKGNIFHDFNITISET